MAKQTHVLYSVEVHRRLVEYFRAGVFKVHAAAACRMTEAELDEWLEAGRRGREPYATLARDVDQAIADDVIRNQTVVSRAATGDGNPRADVSAAKWNLERKHPHLYGRQAVDVTPGGTIERRVSAAAADDSVQVPASFGVS